MICPNCGSENKDDATFCQFCGQRFGPKTNNQADTENKTTDDTMYGSWNNQQSDQNSSWNQQQSAQNNSWNNQQGSQNNDWNDQQSFQNNSWNNQQQNSQNNGWNQQQNGSGYQWNSQQNSGWNNQQGWSDNGFNNYQNNGYQQPFNNGPQPYNGFAIAALIIGILSILPCCLFPYIGIPMNIVGLVLAIIGYRKPYGRGMAIASIVINIIFLVLAIVWLVIVLYVYANMDMTAYYDMFENYMY